MFYSEDSPQVVHACLRLVRSSPLTTAIQIASRIFVVWGVLYLYPEVRRLGEILLILFSLPYVSKRSPIDFPMPNRLNVALHGYCVYWAVLFLYPPFSPVMYKHMLAQRRKVLGSPAKKNV
ncbi:unnamed protein product [Dibothriocephalus latus]|uniref:Very-long-chain (3R)-3-hydroxyacyl-CoA dehydratase n=1 Tax=Dibothriocephalus latus TaxID=60516 RepID=A0A3P7NVH4_DIBLA|nr:unnamed protein product [Dibothriocephalus latus]